MWEKCYDCGDKCCCQKIAFLLYVPKEELIPKINTKYPCVFYNQQGLCDVHPVRPTDCRLFPFDILEIDKKYFWVTWNINCQILKEDYEAYLEEHEQKIIPKFKEHLDEYSKFRLEEFLQNYKYKVLREVRLK